MTLTATGFERGELAIDVAELSVVRVTDPDVGSILDQKDAMRDLITKSEGNQACGFTAETPCLEVVYVGLDAGDMEYTMPATRIKTSDALTDELQRLVETVGVEELQELFEPGPRDTALDDFTTDD